MISAVPVLPANTTPSTVSPVAVPSWVTRVIMSVSWAAASSLDDPVLLVGVQLLSRSPIGVGGILEEGGFHQHAPVCDCCGDLGHLQYGSQRLALGPALADSNPPDIEVLAARAPRRR